MILLSLKIRASKFIYLFFFLVFATSIIANDSIPEINFKAHCESSDAYLLYAYEDVSYVRTWRKYKRQTEVSSKMVINTRAGVEEYAFINLNLLAQKNIKEFKIETLKADGTKVEMDSTLIFDQESKDEQLGQITYPIPGVEPGDTILIDYLYYEHLNENELKDYVDLYRKIPSLKTEYSIRTHPDLLIYYKTYNGFPKPQVLSNDTIVYCLFKMENIVGQEQNKYTCLQCELPYVYYSLDKKGNELRTWKEVYNQEFNFITQPIKVDSENSTYYRRWKKRVLGEAIDSSKYYKLNLLHKDVFTNMEMEAFKEEEMIKSSGFFLKEKRFDPFSIRRLYRQVLEELEIDYWAVFARSKQAGDIDPFYIRKGEYDHIFFAYDNGQGGFNLLYPHDINYKYHINEIPTSIYNTNAIIAKPYRTKKIKRSEKFIGYDFQMAEVDSVILNSIALPGMTASSNYLKQMYYCDVDTGKRSTSFSSVFTVSGGLSTNLRSFIQLINKNKEMNQFYDAVSEYEGDDSVFEIDTVTNIHLKSVKPFIFKVETKGKLNENVSFINDSILSITLDKIIKHNKIETSTDSTQLSYYLDYAFTDLFTMVITFPSEIKVLGTNNKKQLINSYGNYLFSCTVSNSNQLIIQSIYAINKDMIPEDDYDKLKAMNKLANEVKNSRIMIKLL